MMIEYFGMGKILKRLVVSEKSSLLGTIVLGAKIKKQPFWDLAIIDIPN